MPTNLQYALWVNRVCEPQQTKPPTLLTLLGFAKFTTNLQSYE